VLLSHDHHKDNLDDAGALLLPAAGIVLTTSDAAGRLGGNAAGLAPWDEARLAAADGAELIVTATPARHGPAGGDRGPVVGFALRFADDPERAVWFSGDTVWYDDLEEVFDRFRVRIALLNLGAARVAPAGDHPLTMTASGAVEVARALPDATLVGLHFEGWEHFSESRDDVERALAAAGLAGRISWLPPGEPAEIRIR
jgi:L-ascorbate metabolism protein UlaG (beta-lactamase superfamily)